MQELSIEERNKKKRKETTKTLETRKYGIRSDGESTKRDARLEPHLIAVQTKRARFKIHVEDAHWNLNCASFLHVG